MATGIDSEKIKARIAEIVRKIHTEADPNLLTQYRSLFKKEVSFFRRSYVAAYLLMEREQMAESAGGGQRGGRSRRAPQANGAALSGGEDNPRPESAKPHPLPEEEAVRLFVNLGKSRRVFAKDLLSLIIARASVPREDIGLIRTLDNYSFVQVRIDRAGEIITALHGTTFRGRSLTVNYARSHKPVEEEGRTEEAPYQEPAAEPSGEPEGGLEPDWEDLPSLSEEEEDHPDEKSV